MNIHGHLFCHLPDIEWSDKQTDRRTDGEDLVTNHNHAYDQANIIYFALRYAQTKYTRPIKHGKGTRGCSKEHILRVPLRDPCS